MRERKMRERNKELAYAIRALYKAYEDSPEGIHKHIAKSVLVDALWQVYDMLETGDGVVK
jgi:hypothetical protein